MATLRNLDGKRLRLRVQRGGSSHCFPVESRNIVLPQLLEGSHATTSEDRRHIRLAVSDNLEFHTSGISRPIDPTDGHNALTTHDVVPKSLSK